MFKVRYNKAKKHHRAYEVVKFTYGYDWIETVVDSFYTQSEALCFIQNNDTLPKLELLNDSAL